MDEPLQRVIDRAEARGWTAADARRRLAELGWDALLPLLADELAPEVVADDLRRHTRCQVCGHPLHQVVGDLRVPAGARELLVRALPHTAACSCGYARPLLPAVWAVLVGRHLAAHPEAETVEAGTLLRP